MPWKKNNGSLYKSERYKRIELLLLNKNLIEIFRYSAPFTKWNWGKSFSPEIRLDPTKPWKHLSQTSIKDKLKILEHE